MEKSKTLTYTFYWLQIMAVVVLGVVLQRYILNIPFHDLHATP